MRDRHRLAEVLRTLNPAVVGPHVYELAQEAAHYLGSPSTINFAAVDFSRALRSLPEVKDIVWDRKGKATGRVRLGRARRVPKPKSGSGGTSERSGARRP